MLQARDQQGPGECGLTARRRRFYHCFEPVAAARCRRGPRAPRRGELDSGTGRAHQHAGSPAHARTGRNAHQLRARQSRARRAWFTAHASTSKVVPGTGMRVDEPVCNRECQLAMFSIIDVTSRGDHLVNSRPSLRRARLQACGQCHKNCECRECRGSLTEEPRPKYDRATKADSAAWPLPSGPDRLRHLLYTVSEGGGHLLDAPVSSQPRSR